MTAQIGDCSPDTFSPAPSQQYLNQFENCCGLREGAILTLLSDIVVNPQPRTLGRSPPGRGLAGVEGRRVCRSLRRWGLWDRMASGGLVRGRSTGPSFSRRPELRFPFLPD